MNEKQQTKADELAKAYDPKQVDARWYEFWERKGYFKADADSDKPSYCIVIPPPNVTGVLHMGHGLVMTLQDVLIRWKRMLGWEVLWVPGTDHAGIATQTVVERHLIKTLGKRRKDFSREEFLSYVWNWKEKSEGTILEQLKKLGCSCDWTRTRFTMDEGNNRAVRTQFKSLYERGLIYRGDYLVNWDPVTQTALADDEVEYEEKESYLWYFKYPFTDGSGHAVIATTRPETMLGDTAVAVSPKDERYKHLIGKKIRLPLVHREIPIIADQLVDPEFGTGMVKMTPAHDPNDYQAGFRHNLPFINIMTPEGNINENGGRFAGLTMQEAREAVVEAMAAEGLLDKKVPHQLRVGISYRSKAIIEPYMSKQWFVKTSGFSDKLQKAVREGDVKLIPKNWENTYFHWVDNLRDWCISRQLWWGHRIPIWYNKEDPEKIICYDGEGIPPEVESDPSAWEQESDVLDTWFSAGLWPFATLGWPDKTADLAKFYPNSVLVTGHDILFFWVARMLMMGEDALGRFPFPEVFLHGLIFGKSYWRHSKDGSIAYVSDEERDAFDRGKPLPKDVISKWEKMSKSKGNVIDPLEVIDEYGTDAVRMALCAGTTQAPQIDLDRRRFEEFKNFANKVWNGARFVFMNLDQDNNNGLPGLTSEEFARGLNRSLLSLEDHWILSTLNRVIDKVNSALTRYTFDQAATSAYDFFWKEFCAYYLEIAKPVLFGKRGTPEERVNKQKILAIVLCASVRLLHPMAPFITEELFHQLKQRLGDTQAEHGCDPYTQECAKALQADSCIVAPYPQTICAEDINTDIERGFSLMSEIVYTVRNIRGEMKIPPGMDTDLYILGNESDPDFLLVKKYHGILGALVKTHQIKVSATQPHLPLSSTGIIGSLKVLVPLPEEMQEQEIDRLIKGREKAAQNLERVTLQLSNEDFVSRAPKEMVKKQQALQAQLENELAEIARKLASFS